MIQPIQFLWRQLNGPQITAITQAIYHWIKDMFDDILDYFKYFRISSATFEHLQTIGVLNSFPLPILVKYNGQFFFFTYEKEHDAEKGFASLDDRSVGGKFSSMEEHTKTEMYLDAESYRTLLQAVIEIDAKPNSLRYLDTICKTLVELNGEEGAYYRFVYDERNPGSITVFLGGENLWTDPTMSKALIETLAKTIYYPEPILVPQLSTYEPVPSTDTIVADPSIFTSMSENDYGNIITMYVERTIFGNTAQLPVGNGTKLFEGEELHIGYRQNGSILLQEVSTIVPVEGYVRLYTSPQQGGEGGLYINDYGTFHLNDALMVLLPAEEVIEYEYTASFENTGDAIFTKYAPQGYPLGEVSAGALIDSLEGITINTVYLDWATSQYVNVPMVVQHSPCYFVPMLSVPAAWGGPQTDVLLFKVIQFVH